MNKTYYVYGESPSGMTMVLITVDRLWKASKMAVFMGDFWTPVLIVDATALIDYDA